MIQTAIYTKHDGIVDWRYCVTKKNGDDFEVPAPTSEWLLTLPHIPLLPSGLP
jgi:hypothetical protein